jgi:hypothetical protein
MFGDTAPPRCLPSHREGWRAAALGGLDEPRMFAMHHFEE